MIFQWLAKNVIRKSHLIGLTYFFVQLFVVLNVHQRILTSSYLNGKRPLILSYFLRILTNQLEGHGLFWIGRRVVHNRDSYKEERVKVKFMFEVPVVKSRSNMRSDSVRALRAYRFRFEILCKRDSYS